jgi:hypothetical protein
MHVPHTPYAQEDCNSTPASRRASSADFSAGTRMICPVLATLTSKGTFSAGLCVPPLKYARWIFCSGQPQLRAVVMTASRNPPGPQT